MTYSTLTLERLETLFNVLKRFILTEKKMRQWVLKSGPDKDRKLRECDEAIAALVALKDFAKQHVEEPPEQVMLFDEPVRRGGY